MSMDRFVMRHPDTGGVAVIPASSLALHKAQGWLRVSDPIAEHDAERVRLADYADAPDLDPPAAAEPDAEPVPESRPAKTTKEK